MGSECCRSSVEPEEGSLELQSKTKEIIRRIVESNQQHIITRIQTSMKTYLAMKQANAIKYGSYGFKDFNED